MRYTKKDSKNETIALGGRVRRVIPAGIAIAVLASLSLLNLHGSPALKDVAVRLGPFREMRPETGKIAPTNWEWSYQWVSPSVIFGQRPAYDSRLTLYNLKTRQDTPLLRLSRAYDEERDDKERVSPDGQRLLWEDYLNHSVHVVTLDGTQQRVWTTRSFPHALVDALDAAADTDDGPGTDLRWAADSRHWVSFVTDTAATRCLYALVGDVDEPRLRAVPIVSDSLLTYFTRNNRPPYGARATDAVMRGDRVLLSSYDVVGKRTFLLGEVDLGQQGKTVHCRWMALPRAQEIEQAILSPDGNRVALLTREQRVEPLVWLLHRLFPRYPSRVHTVERVSVATTDGALQEVGWVEVPAGREMDFVEHMQWLPDGRSLSYCVNDTLWRVAVP